MGSPLGIVGVYDMIWNSHHYKMFSKNVPDWVWESTIDFTGFVKLCKAHNTNSLVISHH